MDFFWSTQNPDTQDVRCEGGESVDVTPKPISAIAGDAGNFVWDPLQPRSGNVYPVWGGADGLAQAIAAIQGQKSVTIANATLCHVTTGAWPGITDVTFIAGEGSPLGAEVTLDNGATFTFPTDGGMRITLDGVDFVCASTSQVVSEAGSDIFVLVLKNDAQIVQTGGGGRFLHMAGTSVLLAFLYSSGIGANVIATQDTATLEFFCFDGSSFGASAIGGAVGGQTVGIALDGASQAGLPAGTVTGGPTLTVQTLDPQPTFVFSPGATGILDGNVFTTWAALMAAVSLTAGPKTIYVDDNLGAAHVTTVSGGSPWNIDLCTFVANFDTLGTAELIFDTGAVVAFNQIWLDGGIIFQHAAGAAAPAFALASGFACINLRGLGTELVAAGAQPWGTVGNGTFLSVIIDDNAIVGDGAHNALNALAGGTLNIVAASAAPNTSPMLAHAFGGAGTLNVSYTTTFPTTQDTTTQAFTYEGFANEAAATGNTGTGTATVTVVTGNLARKKSGKVLVTCSVAGVITSAGATVTAQLKRDATNIGSTQAVAPLSVSDAFMLGPVFVDTLPDAAAHTYTLSVSASAGNLTVAATSAQISAVEL